MHFEEGNIYHIYNQGNNRQKIFFVNKNYHFFLRKIRIYILPYVDIIAWCLMPNHFHLMILVNKVEIPLSGMISNGFAQSETIASNSEKRRTLNQSIGIMLRSYTNAINKQEKRTGALFRQNTKAECVNCFKGLTPNFIMDNGVTSIKNIFSEDQYPQVLFNYIHQNPVKAGLVKREIDWEFSSAKDYAGLRDGKLINKKIAKEYVQW